MISGVFMCNFKTYTRYSWVADEEQKKDLRCVKVAIAFLNSLKGTTWKKSLGNPGLHSNTL